MKIAELRRKINDSNIGQYINNSFLGILTEGISRELTDTVDKVKYGTMILGASLLAKKRPLQGTALGIATAGLALTDSVKDIDPETHYSHESPIYDKKTLENGTAVMTRVPVKDALIGKIAEYSPATAVGIILMLDKGPEMTYEKPEPVVRIIPTQNDTFNFEKFGNELEELLIPNGEKFNPMAKCYDNFQK